MLLKTLIPKSVGLISYSEVVFTCNLTGMKNDSVKNGIRLLFVCSCHSSLPSSPGGFELGVAGGVANRRADGTELLPAKNHYTR